MSKEGFGYVEIHLINLLFATVFSEDSEHNNECVWYTVSLLADNIFGSFVCWILTLAVNSLAAKLKIKVAL